MWLFSVRTWLNSLHVQKTSCVVAGGTELTVQRLQIRGTARSKIVRSMQTKIGCMRNHAWRMCNIYRKWNRWRVLTNLTDRPVHLIKVSWFFSVLVNFFSVWWNVETLTWSYCPNVVSNADHRSRVFFSQKCVKSSVSWNTMFMCMITV